MCYIPNSSDLCNIFHSLRAKSTHFVLVCQHDTQPPDCGGKNRVEMLRTWQKWQQRHFAPIYRCWLCWWTFGRHTEGHCTTLQNKFNIQLGAYNWVEQISINHNIQPHCDNNNPPKYNQEHQAYNAIIAATNGGLTSLLLVLDHQLCLSRQKAINHHVSK
jgi:hypothetical protein